ncbi:Ankyrin repeat domain-containing protein [Candidatus Trichorickettsia mobilis]|uniref:Ankyrin repeat domain-containing protein n=1 Tax=Candidatus Trichorickettsia mobilis TaxID=1346319 RepID=A0ABZ0UUR6_9RICK|nr:ankyrin repeat domain-containing protein [Candidatus Trichorickettsia mobilis]WPY01351.1 Ankyrin repeat domain-containing protein [Candidatus Trichorickettsia mobilis]
MKVKNKIDSTELINATIAGSLKKVEKLIPTCDVNEPNSLGNTPLMLARNPEIIKALISAGARINDRNHDNNTALILAVQNNLQSKVQLLLGYSQTDIYVRNNDGNVALTYAKEGSVIQKILIDESHKQAAKITSKNYLAKPLINDDSDLIIPAFLSNLVDEQLALAAIPKNNAIPSTSIVNTQINSIIIGLQNNVSGDTAALIFAREDKLDINIIRVLIKANKDLLNIQNDEGSTVLIEAIIDGKLETVELLMELRNEGIEINLDLQDADGNTALHYASQNHELEIAECLMINGANPNLRNNQNQTPFDLAINEENMLSILGDNQIQMDIS